MKTTLTFLVFLISSQFAFNQVSPADSLREIGLLDEAIEQYDIMYQFNPNDYENTYNYACALALNQQIDSALKYLEIAIIDGVDLSAFNDPDFYFLIEEPRWDSLQNIMIEKLEKQYGAYKNVGLSKELWTMKIKDQAFYYHERLAEDKVTKSAIWELTTLLNEQKLQRLNEIINDYGYPTNSLVGGSAAGAVFLIIQHANLETQKKYLPLMKKAVDEGEANASNLALLIDRIEIREGRKQIYGSQIIQNEDGSFNLDTLFEPEYVNQRRATMG